MLMLEWDVTEAQKRELRKEVGNSSWSTRPLSLALPLSLVTKVTRQVSPDGFLSASLCYPVFSEHAAARSVPTHLSRSLRPA